MIKGHSIEISWFLLHLNKYLNDGELREIALDGLIGALDIGYDQVHGGITYMIDILNMPLMDTTVTAEHKLWWPMSEALYATVLAFEETQDTVSRSKAPLKHLLRTLYRSSTIGA